MTVLVELAELTPAAPAPDWSGARCAEADPEAWFPVQGRHDRDEYAKRICAGCELRPECLAWAVATRQRHGIWGGLSESERRGLRVVVTHG